MAKSRLPINGSWIELDLSALSEISDDAFFDLCQANPELDFERLASGEIIVMVPAGSASSNRNARLTAAVLRWADEDGTGLAFGPDGGFKLPNGATRGPDVAWVSKARLGDVPPEVNSTAQVELSGGIPFVSDADLESAMEEAGVPPDKAQTITDLNADALAKHLAERRKKPRAEGGLSPQSCVHVVRAVKQFTKWACHPSRRRLPAVYRSADLSIARPHASATTTSRMAVAT